MFQMGFDAQVIININWHKKLSQSTVILELYLKFN